MTKFIVHLILLLVCVLSVEVYIRFKFLFIFDSFLKVSKKVIYVIPRNNISDHWKEKVIPAYAFRMMKYSLQLLLILLLIISFFLAAGNLFDDFFPLTFSFFGIIESTALAVGYVYARKSVLK